MFIIPPCRPSGTARGEYQSANAKIRPAYRKDTTFLRSVIRDRRWAVQPMFLASRGHEYVLGLNFVNEASTTCLVSSVRIQIPRGRVIVESRPSGKLGSIPSGTGLAQQVRFEESPRLRRFLAILTATGGRDCKSAVVPIDFN